MPSQSATRSLLTRSIRHRCRHAGNCSTLVRPFRFGVWLIATVLFLAACGGSSPDDVAVVAESANETLAEPAPTATPQPVADGPAPFPSTVVASSTGGQIDFGSLAGQDTVLWFWAPW